MPLVDAFNEFSNWNPFWRMALVNQSVLGANGQQPTAPELQIHSLLMLPSIACPTPPFLHISQIIHKLSTRVPDIILSNTFQINFGPNRNGSGATPWSMQPHVQSRIQLILKRMRAKCIPLNEHCLSQNKL